MDRPFGATSLERLDSPNLPAGPFIVRGNLLEPVTQRTLYSEEAISELELLMNSGTAAESDFQRLFERWPILLTGLDYAQAHFQPILHRDEGGTLIPDFFLEKVEGGWDAIVDLKKPYDEMVVRRPNRIYFRQWVAPFWCSVINCRNVYWWRHVSLADCNGNHGIGFRDFLSFFNVVFNGGGCIINC